MRLFLESFVLRGEAQSIKRIVEVYANHDCETQPIESEDAAFILSHRCRSFWKNRFVREIVL